MTNGKDITLFGAIRCHKTRHYIKFLEQLGLPFVFKDVEKNEMHAEQLINLFDSGKLNFPTFLLDGKKLRNPKDDELLKQLRKRGFI